MNHSISMTCIRSFILLFVTIQCITMLPLRQAFVSPKNHKYRTKVTTLWRNGIIHRPHKSRQITTSILLYSSSSTKPDITIEYCTGCRWMLRSAWIAQELLTTFRMEINSVTLLPSRPPSPAGTFVSYKTILLYMYIYIF